MSEIVNKRMLESPERASLYRWSMIVRGAQGRTKEQASDFSSVDEIDDHSAFTAETIKSSVEEG